MTETTERPLVTFAVIAYNQERYIREAIEGAFAQTYEPLEIILSDDCSPDRTYEIMQEMTAAYDGPHTVALNRNSRNLGLMEHINKLATLISTDIVVFAAGDDISHPSRTTLLTEVFQRDPSVKAVLSNVNSIENLTTGNGISSCQVEIIPMKALLFNGGGAGIGASYAYHHDCLVWPSKLAENLISEDRILPFRAALLGRVCHVSEALVRYRRSDDGLVGKLRRENSWAIMHPPHIKELKKELKVSLDQGLIEESEFKSYFRTINLRHNFARLSNKRGKWGDALIRIIFRNLQKIFLENPNDIRGDHYFLDRAGPIPSIARPPNSCTSPPNRKIHKKASCFDR